MHSRAVAAAYNLIQGKRFQVFQDSSIFCTYKTLFLLLIGITTFFQCQLLPSIITHQTSLSTARFPVMNCDLWLGRSDSLLKLNVFITKRTNKAPETNEHQFIHNIICSKLNYFSLLIIHGNY